MSLPPLIPWQQVRERLLVVFPEGTPDRGYLVREATAKTVFTALYVGAIAGMDRWIAPRHVVRMSDAQAAQQDEAILVQGLQRAHGAHTPLPTSAWARASWFFVSF